MDYSGLEVAAGNLLRVILGVKVGAQVAPASPTARQVATVQKQRFREWVADLQNEYEIAYEQSSADPADDDDDDEIVDMDDEQKEQMLLDKIDGLKLELREAALERARETNLVERLRTTSITAKAMFPDEGNASADFTLSDTEAKYIAARVDQRDALSGEMLQLTKEIEAKRAALRDVRRQNKTLVNENRAAMKELKELSDESSTPVASQEGAVGEATEALAREQQRSSILRNTFQALIVGSGVDWAADPELQGTLLDLATAPGP